MCVAQHKAFPWRLPQPTAECRAHCKDIQPLSSIPHYLAHFSSQVGRGIKLVTGHKLRLSQQEHRLGISYNHALVLNTDVYLFANLIADVTPLPIRHDHMHTKRGKFKIECTRCNMRI